MRLTLQRETLQNLDPDQLSDVNGGSTPLCLGIAVFVATGAAGVLSAMRSCLTCVNPAPAPQPVQGQQGMGMD